MKFHGSVAFYTLIILIVVFMINPFLLPVVAFFCLCFWAIGGTVRMVLPPPDSTVTFGACNCDRSRGQSCNICRAPA